MAPRRFSPISARSLFGLLLDHVLSWRPILRQPVRAECSWRRPGTRNGFCPHIVQKPGIHFVGHVGKHKFTKGDKIATPEKALHRPLSLRGNVYLPLFQSLGKFIEWDVNHLDFVRSIQKSIGQCFLPANSCNPSKSSCQVFFGISMIGISGIIWLIGTWNLVLDSPWKYDCSLFAFP